MTMYILTVDVADWAATNASFSKPAPNMAATMDSRTKPIIFPIRENKIMSTVDLAMDVFFILPPYKATLYQIEE